MQARVLQLVSNNPGCAHAGHTRRCRYVRPPTHESAARRGASVVVWSLPAPCVKLARYVRTSWNCSQRGPGQGSPVALMASPSHRGPNGVPFDIGGACFAHTVQTRVLALLCYRCYRCLQAH